MSEISMPRLSDTMQEGTITRWLKRPGDKVKRGDIVAEVETDKANMEIESYENGVLEQILVNEGETVSVGSTIALVKELETAQMDRSLSTPRHSDGSFTTFLDYLEGFYV
jgi:pyruvate dehydrogenase E2 component (dihydrolipoamide acetyltransferase)